MTLRVLVIGGYGNFGRYISQSLAAENNIQLLIAGRNLDKARQLAGKLATSHNAVYAPLAVRVDIHQNFSTVLAETKPHVVVHTSGPFQGQQYAVAEACIGLGIHYIDLADGREFVRGFTQLHDRAVQHDVVAISGASSVPCLSSAIVDHFRQQFQHLDSIDYGITVAQKTTRGLATTEAILGYVGKPFNTWENDEWRAVYGWQGLHIRKYRHLGYRLLGNCDIPDLELFPGRYPGLQRIRFRAGMELPVIHLGLWMMSWLVRCRLVGTLQPLAAQLVQSAMWFDRFGSDQSAFHMILTGSNREGQPLEIVTELTARSGHGPYIPCIPAIILCRKLAANRLDARGAFPCLGMVMLPDYLQAMEELDIVWEVTRNPEPPRS